MSLFSLYLVREGVHGAQEQVFAGLNLLRFLRA